MASPFLLVPSRECGNGGNGMIIKSHGLDHSPIPKNIMNPRYEGHRYTMIVTPDQLRIYGRIDFYIIIMAEYPN